MISISEHFRWSYSH